MISRFVFRGFAMIEDIIGSDLTIWDDTGFVARDDHIWKDDAIFQRFSHSHLGPATI